MLASLHNVDTSISRLVNCTTQDRGLCPRPSECSFGIRAKRHFAIASGLRERYDSVKARRALIFGKELKKCVFAEVSLEPLF
jgi:hypothetical protein